MKLLLVKTSSMGDVIHNLAVASDIQRRRPEVAIDWLVEEAFAEIPVLHPAVTGAIPVALRRWRKNLFRPGTWREVVALRRRLRLTGYDTVLDTQGLLKSALVARWAQCPVSGYDRYSIREPMASRFYAHQYSVSRHQHAVDRNRQLAADALEYDLDDLPLDYGITAPAVEHEVDGLGSSYIVCLHGTSRDSKLWPELHWHQLIQQLAANGLQALLPWGNEVEHRRAQRLAAQSPAAVVPDRLTLRQLTALFGSARGAVGVDTGPVHLAAALGCITVALYTDTDPGFTGVMPMDPERGVNLGSIGRPPTVEEVMTTLSRTGIT